ncbi:unnamed protein product [Cyprideis torosa]|uniref:Uncharacterized protein n=1 Tax=Cyprideis torosa TaxID=163714 RepID=A0A7R8WFX3_9CRUS|nr:unnamed protein product [Cyprideis torosa]CAG0894654.1 unnamed protein product [Cyprideis torosa]
MDDMVRRNTDRETLCQVIQQWNANRLDLFALTNPNENLEFQGVMRFYFQDIGQKVATKCVRVSSVQSTKEIIDCLIEKFRPDMRMLTIPDYALYEIHENGDERRLGQEEKPLLVQLNWHRDDREGRFLLRRIDGATPIFPPMGDESQFRRKLSKREKKQLKKQEKLRRLKSGDSPEHGHHGSMSEQGGTLRGDGSSVAEKLYSELPETSFTRSISNPEAVMRRRRQQKLERKLQLFRSRDGGPDTGGTLKIYGESLCREVPYKTLLLSVHDTAINIVQEMLDKYGIPREEAPNYCLVEVQVPDPPPGSGGSPQAPREYILDDDECPLAILMTQTGSITFHVRRRPPDHMARRRKKKQKQAFDAQGRPLTGDDALPYFLELQPDGTEIRTQAPMRHRLQLNVTEVGCERGNSAGGALLQLFGPGVQSRHCVLAHMEGIVTVTPCSRDAETFVNGQRIYETTLLQHGAIVRFGSSRTFRFMDPMYEDRQPRPPSGSLERGSFASSNLETTFDPEGNVDTVSVGSYQPHNDSRRSWASQHSRSMAPLGTDPILPATLELPEETEEQVLLGLTTSPDPNSTPFKLAPTYSLYMVARYRASVHFRPDLSPPERAIRLTHTLTKASRMIEHTVQAAARDASSLSFWMANSSELLHFLKSDRHISAYSLDAQDILAESVQAAFGFLVDALQVDLDAYLPGILSEDPLGPTGDTRADRMDPILTTLSGTMGLLRRCRVNAALTIQLFSHLFHFLNRWVFNKSPKWTAEDLASLCSACFKLNSLQLNHLLSQYQPEEGEPQVPPEQVDKVVRVCEVSVDELLRADGRPVRLEEEPELSLPFVLPEDGYSCEILRGIPQGLPEFLAPLQSNGLCRLIPQPTSSGYWTVYMGSIDQRVE